MGTKWWNPIQFGDSTLLDPILTRTGVTRQYKMLNHVEAVKVFVFIIDRYTVLQFCELFGAW